MTVIQKKILIEGINIKLSHNEEFKDFLSSYVNLTNKISNDLVIILKGAD